MSNGIRAVVGCPGCGQGCGPGHGPGCGSYVLWDGDLCRIVASRVVGDGEVWEVALPDGGWDLLSTTQLEGVTAHRPPNRPPTT